MRFAAFLISCYDAENESGADESNLTITYKDPLGLVTVTNKGAPHAIVDICLRMLQPAEWYEA